VGLHIKSMHAAVSGSGSIRKSWKSICWALHRVFY